jgi:hypothetical protein
LKPATTASSDTPLARLRRRTPSVERIEEFAPDLERHRRARGWKEEADDLAARGYQDRLGRPEQRGCHREEAEHLLVRADLMIQ